MQQLIFYFLLGGFYLKFERVRYRTLLFIIAYVIVRSCGQASGDAFVTNHIVLCH